MCTNSLKSIKIWVDLIEMTSHTNFRIHFHPKDVYRQGIALVELDQNVSDMEYLIHCLWTNDDDSRVFVTEIQHGLAGISTRVHATYKPDSAISYRLEECTRFIVSLSVKPGDALVTESEGGIVKSVVGVITQQVEDCSIGDALNVVSYLDWIEEIVWKNDTSTKA